jgi:hypothetical protein
MGTMGTAYHDLTNMAWNIGALPTGGMGGPRAPRAFVDGTS